MQVLWVELIRHRLFDLLLFLNGLFELPLQHTLNGDSLDFLANPFFFQKAIESRTAVVRSFCDFSLPSLKSASILTLGAYFHYVWAHTLACHKTDDNRKRQS